MAPACKIWMHEKSTLKVQLDETLGTESLIPKKGKGTTERSLRKFQTLDGNQLHTVLLSKSFWYLISDNK